MKPNFALSLSFDGLRLLHRAQGGWHLVGEVALDDPDLTGALAQLRGAAEGLDPAPMATKLLIPNDQIRYLAIDTTRAGEHDVVDALDGATPYAISDLVYDYAKGGGRTYIAAVAKETLTEAQAFAAEHGFNPISFAAVPEPFTYVGEAFFGGVPGVEAARDSEAVVVVGTTDLAQSVPNKESAAASMTPEHTKANAADIDTPVAETGLESSESLADDDNDRWDAIAYPRGPDHSRFER